MINHRSNIFRITAHNDGFALVSLYQVVKYAGGLSRIIGQFEIVQWLHPGLASVVTASTTRFRKVDRGNVRSIQPKRQLIGSLLSGGAQVGICRG